MTLFEFISVMVSIVLGLSLAQILTGLSQFARNSRRIDAYLPHTLWLISMTLLHFLLWWSFWDYRDTEWNYARFAVIVIEPLLVFLASSILIPRKFDEDVINLHDYFHGIRRWFFLSWILLQGLFIVDGPLVFQTEAIWIGYRVSQIAISIALVLGFLTANRWVQHISAWVVLGTLAWASTARFLPAAFE